MPRAVGLLLAGFLALPGLACKADDKKEEKKGTVVTLDGLSSRTPADWEEIKTTRPFRFKEFKVPRVKDEERDAELIIFHFGEGGGGSVKDNMKRWKDMFQPPAGKSIDDATKVEEFKVGAVPVTYVDINGTYLFKVSPMAEKAEPRPKHRMLVVFFDSDKGPYFIRLVGPEKTIAQHKKGFDEWIKGFK